MARPEEWGTLGNETLRGFETFANARGVLYHSAFIDPGVKYPPYSEHTAERKVMDKLL
jgi:aldehyde dehydrogenase (NAD+)